MTSASLDLFPMHVCHKTERDDQGEINVIGSMNLLALNQILNF